MHRTRYGAAKIQCTDGRTAKLWYNLLCETRGRRTCFGVEIVMLRGGERQSACVRDLAASQRQAEWVLAKLCRNTVTPCMLYEVLEELLAR